MKMFKRIFAVALSIMLVAQALPASLFTIHAISNSIYANEYVNVKTENGSSDKESKLNEDLNVEEALPSHTLSIVVNVDGSGIAPVAIPFNEYNPGKTVIEALEGYEVTSATLDGEAFSTNNGAITFASTGDETKSLVINVSKVVSQPAAVKANTKASNASYKVNFYVNGKVASTKTYSEGSTPSFRNTPHSNNGKFVGWATEPNSKNYIPAGTDLPKVTANEDYYAIFVGIAHFYFVLPGKDNTSTNSRDYMYAGDGTAIIRDEFKEGIRMYDGSDYDISKDVVTVPTDAAIRKGLESFYDGKEGRDKYDPSWSYDIRWYTYLFAAGSVGYDYQTMTNEIRVHIDAKLTVNTNTKSTLSYSVQKPDGTVFSGSTRHNLKDIVEINSTVTKTGKFTTDGYSFDAESKYEGNNYQFDGWYTDESFTTKAPNSVVASESHFYYGRYINKTFTLTFDATSGSFSNGEKTLTAKHDAGDLANLVTPTKPGYAFDGWKRDDKEHDVPAGNRNIVMPEYDLTLTAKWKFDSKQWFDITYADAQGNEFVKRDIALENETIDVLDFDSKELGFKAPTGKYFTGWKVTAGDAKHANGKLTFKDKDVVLTAQYGDLYNIHFYENPKKDPIPELVNNNSYKSGDFYTLPDYDGGHDASDNHNFVGWTTKPELFRNNEGVVNDEKDLEALRDPANGFVENKATVEFKDKDIDLYAIWATKKAIGVEVSYTVKYFVDGVERTSDEQKEIDYVLSNEVKQLAFKGIVETKYESEGYIFDSMTPNYAIGNMVANGTVIKVQYTKDPLKWFSVTYEAGDHGTGPAYTDGSTHKAGSSVKAANFADTGFVTEYGYKFKNWEIIEGDATFVPGITLNILIREGNVKVKAVYERDLALWNNVTYKAGAHGTGADKVQEDQARKNDVVNVLSFANAGFKANDGYEFTGWKVVSGNVTIANNQFTMGDSNVVLEAQYAAKDYNYSIHYFYDEVEDDSLKEVGSAKFLTTIDKYTDNAKEKFAFERVEGLPITISSDASKNVMNVYYATDDNEDKIPDKFQRKVTFKVVNGAWNDGKTDDVTAFVTLRDANGDPSLNGKATLDKVPTVGDKPLDGYKAGNWNTVLADVVITKDTKAFTFTYTYVIDENKKDTLKYTVNHIGVDKEGKETVLYSKTDSEEFLVANHVTKIAVKDTVLKANATYSKYVFDRMEPKTAAGDKVANETVINLYFDADNNEDDTPDKFQRDVTFKVKNGAWNDGKTADVTKTVDLRDANGDLSVNGTATLDTVLPAVGDKPLDGYKAGDWNTDVTQVEITKDTTALTFTYTYVIDENKKDTLKYTVKHIGVDKDGKETELYSKTDSEEFLVAHHVTKIAVKDSVLQENITYPKYVFDRMEPVVTAGDKVTNGKVIKMYFDADNNEDDTPDKFQRDVTFKVKNGAWNDGKTADVTKTVDLRDANGDLSVNGTATLDTVLPAVGDKPLDGYKAGDWNTDVTQVEITKDTTALTFTYTYVIDENKKDTLKYTVKHIGVDKDGKETELYSKTDSEEFLVAHHVTKIAVKDSVLKENITYPKYLFDRMEPVVTAGAKVADGTVIKMYFDADNDEDKKPDKFQRYVSFKVVNGAWDNDETDVVKAKVLLTDENGDLSVNGKATLDKVLPAVGNKPLDGYKAGNWDTDVTKVVITKDTTALDYTYTYVIDENKKDTLEYIVNHIGVDKEGNETTLYSEKGTEQFLVAHHVKELAVKDSVLKENATYPKYLFDRMEPEVTAGDKVADKTVINLYFDEDNNEDKIPDKFQKHVTFKVVNGAWNDESTDDVAAVVNLRDANGDLSVNGKATLDTVLPAVGDKPLDGYKAGSWDTDVTKVEITKDTTALDYTYTYVIDENKKDTLEYIVNHIGVDKEGNETTLYSEKGTEQFLVAHHVKELAVKDSVLKENATYPKYLFDRMEPEVTAGDKVADKTVINLYFDEDNNEDEIPDKFQRDVTFKVVDGAWDDESTDDVSEIVNLRDANGKLSVNGSATLDTVLPAVGNKPLDGYKAGNWDTDVTKVVITKDTTELEYTYTYVIDEEKQDTLTYTVNHIGVDREGNETELYSTTDSEQFLVAHHVTKLAVKDSVLKADATYGNYVFDRMDPAVAANDEVADGTEINLYFDIDVNEDEIADKYQAIVTYAAVNGTVAFNEVYVTLFDADGKYAIDGTGYLSADQIPAATANAGYNQASLVWLSGVPSNTTAITRDVRYTVAFAATVVPTPITPPTLPLLPVPTPAPAPAPTPTPTPPVENVEPEETPKAEGNEKVEDKETPKADLGSWALINLIATTGTVLLGVFLLLAKRRKEEENEELETPEEKKRNLWMRVFTTFVAIASVIAFVLTEDMTLKLALIDKWTVVMVVLFLVQAVAFIFARRWKEVNNKEKTSR